MSRHTDLEYLNREFRRLTCDENLTQGEALEAMAEEIGNYTVGEIISYRGQCEDHDDAW